jgi:hypothetical protein
MAEMYQDAPGHRLEPGFHFRDKLEAGPVLPTPAIAERLRRVHGEKHARQSELLIRGRNPEADAVNAARIRFAFGAKTFNAWRMEPLAQSACAGEGVPHPPGLGGESARDFQRRMHRTSV